MGEILLAIFKTGSGTLLNLILGIFTTKLLAINLGPAGIGLFSLLRQTRDVLITITTLNGSAAFVQGLASRQGKDREDFNGVVFLTVIASTLLVVLILLTFAQPLTRLILHQDDQQSVALIRGLYLPLLFGSGVFYFTGVLNGYRAIGRLVIVQVSVAAVTAVLAYPVARWVAQGVPSAFISMMAVSTAAGSLIGAIFTYKEKWLPRLQTLHTILAGGQFISLEYQFLSFALTTMITGFASTGTVLIVRSMIVGHLGLAEAGIFDVGWTLSMVYITMALTSFGAYYLPTLSQTNSPTESTLLINRVLRLCMIIYVPLITALVVFIPLLVSVLYSLQFLSSLGMIRWMLLGTYFKAISWIFAMTIFAAADKKTLLWTEAAWMAGFLIFSAISLIRFQTIEWVGLGFTINYALYLIYTYWYARKCYRFTPGGGMFVKWMAGLLIIAAASFTTWNSTHVQWLEAILWILAAGAYAYLVLETHERHKFSRWMTQKMRNLFLLKA
jgi:O-antigen/teichoic acid export membrane protein